jgi:hypothetical protein
MPALVAGIHVFLLSYRKQDVEGRVKPGHDENEISEIPGERSETRDRNGRRGWPVKPGHDGVSCTQDCVEICGNAPRISTIAIPYRAGSTKTRFDGGDGDVSAQAVGR